MTVRNPETPENSLSAAPIPETESSEKNLETGETPAAALAATIEEPKSSDNLEAYFKSLMDSGTAKTESEALRRTLEVVKKLAKRNKERSEMLQANAEMTINESLTRLGSEITYGSTGKKVMDDLKKQMDRLTGETGGSLAALSVENPEVAIDEAA